MLNRPHLACAGSQREPLRITVAVAVHERRRERITGRGGAGRGIDSQHLPGQACEVLGIRFTAGVAGGHPQVAVGTEPKPAAGVAITERDALDEGIGDPGGLRVGSIDRPGDYPELEVTGILRWWMQPI